MWAVSAWALVTWLKVTAALALLVGLAWLVWGAGSGQFLLAVIGAVLLDGYAVEIDVAALHPADRDGDTEDAEVGDQGAAAGGAELGR